MKRILLLAFFAIGANAQTVTLTANTTYGSNCGQGQPQEIRNITGDLNLNGFTLTLKNTRLTVQGNLNGNGSIVACGNPNQSQSNVCVNGSVKNNPNLNGLTCNALSLETFELDQSVYGLKFKVYDVKGKLLKTDIVDQFFYLYLPKDMVIIIEVENYKAFKTIIQN